MVILMLLLAMLGSEDFGTRESAQRRLSAYPRRLWLDVEASGSFDFQWRVGRLKQEAEELPLPTEKERP